MDFLGGRVVGNSPANAGDMFNLWSRKIPHAIEQLSPHTTTTEPMVQGLRGSTTEPTAQLLKPTRPRAHSHQLLNLHAEPLKPMHLQPVLRNERSDCSEKPVRCNKKQPLLTATRESLHAATKTQCNRK